MMHPDEEAQLHHCVNTIATILLRYTPPEQLQTLEGIEQAIRSHTQQTVLPQLGLFLLQQRLKQPRAMPEG